MKKFLTITLAVILSAGFLFANTKGKAVSNDPGRKIQETFKNDFPLAADIIWTKNGQGNFIASFNQNNISQQAYYTSAGEYIGQGWFTSYKDIPSLVQERILRFSDPSDIKSIYLFLPPQGLPNHFVRLIKKGKEILLKADSYGQIAIISKKNLPNN